MDPYIEWLTDVVNKVKNNLVNYSCTVSIVSLHENVDVTRFPLQVTDNNRESKNLIIDSNNFIRCYKVMNPNGRYNYDASIKEASNECTRIIKEWLNK